LRVGVVEISLGRVFLVALEPALRADDVGRVGRSGQHLGQQGIGIEGDRAEQLVELVGLELRCLAGVVDGLDLVEKRCARLTILGQLVDLLEGEDGVGRCLPHETVHRPWLVVRCGELLLDVPDKRRTGLRPRGGRTHEPRNRRGQDGKEPEGTCPGVHDRGSDLGGLAMRYFIDVLSLT
jgi:hypothetical protein